MDLIIVASLVIFTILIFTGVPIPFGFLVSTIFLSITKGIEPSFLLPVGFAKMNSVTLLSLPFFIATGYLVTGGSIARRLVDFVNVFVAGVSGRQSTLSIPVPSVFGPPSSA